MEFNLDPNVAKVVIIVAFIWLLLAFLLKHPKRGQFDNVINDLRQYLKKLTENANNISKNVDREKVKETTKAKVNDIFIIFLDALDKLLDLLIGHFRVIKRNISPDPEKTINKVFGNLLLLSLLIVFSIADIIQTFNTISGLYPDMVVPTFFRDLSVSVWVTSFGTIFVLGFALSDFLGLTNYGGWSDLADKPKKVYSTLTVISFLFTIIILIVLGLERFQALSDLPDETVRIITLLANLAQTYLIIPLYLVTILVAHGISGLKVIYWICVGVLIVFFKLLSILTKALRIILIPSAGITIELFTIVLILIAIILPTAIIRGGGDIFVLALRIVALLLTFITGPIDKGVEKAADLIEKVAKSAEQNKQA